MNGYMSFRKTCLNGVFLMNGYMFSKIEVTAVPQNGVRMHVCIQAVASNRFPLQNQSILIQIVHCNDEVGQNQVHGDHMMIHLIKYIAQVCNQPPVKGKDSSVIPN